MSMGEDDKEAVIHTDEQGPFWVQKEVCSRTVEPYARNTEPWTITLSDPNSKPRTFAGFMVWGLGLV